MLIKMAYTKTALDSSTLGNVGSKIKNFMGVHAKELPMGVALAGGIALADAGTEAAFAKPGERGKAALKGLGKGALYGTILAGAEPFLRHGFAKPLHLPT